MSRLKLINHPSKRKNSSISSNSSHLKGSDRIESTYKHPDQSNSKQENPLSSSYAKSSSKPPFKKETYARTSSTLAASKRSKFSVSKTKGMRGPKSIAKKIQNLLPETVPSDFESIQKSFKETIKHDKIFGKLLSKVKKFFEDLLQKFKSLKEKNSKLETEIKDLSSEIQEETFTQEQIIKKIEKFSRENDELEHDLEDKESKYIEMQDQLFKISQLDLSDIPLSQDMWGKLVEQNQMYSQACKELKNKNKEFRNKEKKMLKLVLALKKRGIPVEEIYENEVRKSKQRKYPLQQSDCEEVEDNTENENIVEGPPIFVNKPEIVPALTIEVNEYETSGESSYYTSQSSQST